MAGWVAVIGSALLVLTLFESMSQLRSIEMRETIEEFLSSPPGNGLGLTVAGTVEIVRGLMLVNGAAAAAAMVLGIYVLQRHRGARLGFTVAAMAIMLTAPVSGGFLPVLIAFAALMLWTGPARDWFSGGPSTAAPAAVSDQDREQSGPTSQWPPATSQDASGEHPPPPPTQGFGTPPQPQGEGQGVPPPYYPSQPDPGWAAPAYGQQPQQYAGNPAYARDPEKRPTTVTIAALLTWLFAGLTLLAFSVVVVVLLVAKDQFLDQVRQDQAFQDLDVSTSNLVAGLWVLSSVIIFWCLASIVLAVFAWRRSNGARITLVVSAASAALFSLLAIASLVSALNMLAAGATVALLFLGGANAWYSRKSGSGGYPTYGGPQQGNPYGGPQQGNPYGRAQGQPPREDQQEPPKNVW